jgi:hypothetical protein
MKPTPPIFSGHGHVYTADVCPALREAADKGSVRFNAYGRGHYPGTWLPKSWLQGLMSVGYWDAPAPQDWGLDWHRNEGIEFSSPSTGRTRFAVDNSSYRLSAGALTITRPWQRHRVGEPNVGPGRLYWIILDVGVRRPPALPLILPRLDSPKENFIRNAAKCQGFSWALHLIAGRCLPTCPQFGVDGWGRMDYTCCERLRETGVFVNA